MYLVRFMSTTGLYRQVGEGRYASMSDVLAACRDRYAGLGFARFQYEDCDGDGWRVTATTPGGRAGRNLAYVEPLIDDEREP